ncbi:hypothetical protein [Nonomuraea lactucae]|uniref:hypothetical protein n=1 Tax=Nonomuraea lactucae TaxID=2249762 RepID=UPI0013B3F6DD|nr:hypothetical protein [Nonomuraea lactucae]
MGGAMPGWLSAILYVAGLFGVGAALYVFRVWWDSRDRPAGGVADFRELREPGDTPDD